MLYPTAGEGVIFGRRDGAGGSGASWPVDGDEAVAPGRAPDDPHAGFLAPADVSAGLAVFTSRLLADGRSDESENAERARRRARGRLRRYAVSNGCTWLVTLTYRPPQPTDPDVVLGDVQAFQRRLGERYRGVAWARVFERHRSGALHVHFIASRGFGDERRTRALARLWGHGFVDARRLGRPGEGRRERARSAARYAAKYVGKDAVAGFGRHSYEVRQGFQPEAVRLEAATDREAWTQLVRLMWGEVPGYEWSSAGDTSWRGPPVRFLGW